MILLGGSIKLKQRGEVYIIVTYRISQIETHEVYVIIASTYKILKTSIIYCLVTTCK